MGRQMNKQEEYIIELISGFLAGELTGDELTALRKWIEASEENRNLFEEMKAVWQATGSTDVSGTFDAEKAWRKISANREASANRNRQKTFKSAVPPGKRRPVIRSIRMAAAALIIFFIGGATTHVVFKSEAEETGDRPTKIPANFAYKLSVPHGAKSTMVLPDGSKVFINAGSTLAYAADYGIDSREVTLEGEAYFDVITNPEKPFTIRTSELDIKAYGTAFNVKAYPEDPMIVTTLERGELKVKSRNGNSFDMNIQPKQNVVYYKQNIPRPAQPKNKASADVKADAPPPTPAVSSDVDTRLYTSWKDAEWIIDAQTLGDLAVSLERKYNVRIIFDSKELRNYRFSGTFRNETIEQVLTALAYTAPMKYGIDQGLVKLRIDRSRKQNYDTLSNQYQ